MIRSQRGQTIYLLAIGLAVLLGAVGLAVDTGYAYYYTLKADSAAKAAADGGAQSLPDLGAATARALALVRANGMDPADATVSLDPADATRLIVTVRKTFPVLFIRLLGAGPTLTVSRGEETGAPPAGIVAAAGVAQQQAPPKQTDIPIPFQHCSGGVNAGTQLCDAVFSTSIVTGGRLQAQYVAPRAHCSDGRAHITLDGTVTKITDFVSGGQATQIQDFGTVQPGSHTLSVQFEGRVSGCNVGAPGAWFGTLRVMT
jgi:hypothetical protein